MKKNLTLAVILLIGLVAFFNSCVKDTFTELDAYAEQRKNETLQDSIARSQAELEAQLAKEQAEYEAGLTEQQILLLDSLKKIGGAINYSVAVVSASESSWWSSYYQWWWDKGGKGEKAETGVSAATVTIAQHGRILTATTGTDGIASFSDLRVGTANVNITVAGYTTVDFVVELPPLTEGFHSFVADSYYGSSYQTDSISNNPVDLVRHVATMVPVFSLTTNLSTVTGIATVETDLTNNTPEVAAGVKVIGVIDVLSDDFWSRYIYHPDVLEWWNCDACELRKQFDYYGTIKQIAFGSTISMATTAADGTFTLQVPSTPQGLPITLEYDEIALDQTLLLPTLNGVPVWGPQTVRTIYASGSSTTAIPALGVAANQVQSAYVTIGAPTGAPNAQPTTVATATAVLTSSGIVSINISSQGEGYTQPPLVRISKGSVINSVQAEGTAVLTGDAVTSVTITNAGTGYKPGDTPTVTFVPNIDQTATATPKMGYSLDAIALTNPGAGYTSAPAVTINSGTGTGATAVANMTGYVSSLTLTGGGTGYTATPTVNISTSTGVQATATATMTTANPISSVYVPANLTTWLTRKLGTRITGSGSGAVTDSTTLGSLGRISFINITNAGAGYITAPTVTISGGGGFGATAHATIVSGAVATIVLDSKGEGYTSDPTISITAAPTGGTNATAALRREFQVTGVPLTSSGNGYTAGAAVQFETAPGSGAFVAAPAGVVPVYSMSVASLSLGAAGDGYSAAPTVTITPSNGVVGTAATATAAILYKVKDLSVTAQGSGYEGTDATVSIGAPPAGGTQAVAGVITRTNGVLKRIIMGTPGMGYTAPPNVILTLGAGAAPVQQAEMTATVSGGQVTGITIVDPGQGYSYASDALYGITITTYNSAAAATAQPNPSSGQIDFIQVTNPGAGYSIVPTVEIVNTANLADANTFGTGAVGTAVVTDGRVSAITVTNAGSGYYIAPTVTVTVASTVQNAVAMCTVTSDGRITGVTFPAFDPYTKGYGYDAVPTVTFMESVAGVGSGATGVAILKDGRIDNIVMTNQGSGYIGKNRPGTAQSPTGTGYVNATAGKSYIRDIYFGTGTRTVN